jgi:hypothetical protein
MSTTWVVTTATDRVILDEHGQGETTFTVTNPGSGADRVVFEPVPGRGANLAWFSVEDPQRRVAPAASASFLLRTQVPTGTGPGRYEVQGRVYSADSAPEESSVLSGRLVFEVPEPATATPKRAVPWWVYAAAAALVVVVGIVVTLIATLGGDDKPAAAPAPAAVSPTPSPVSQTQNTGTPAAAKVPKLANLTEAGALDALKQAGLTAGKIMHKYNQYNPDRVTDQTAAEGTTLAAGSAVGFTVTVSLSAPKSITGPSIKTGQPVEWTQAEPWVTQWRVGASAQLCLSTGALGSCDWAPIIVQTVTTPSYVLPLRVPVKGLKIVGVSAEFDTHSQWGVAALDDFGTPGPDLRNQDINLLPAG